VKTATHIKVDEVSTPASIDALDAAGFFAAIHVNTVVRNSAYGDIVIFRPHEELFLSRDPGRNRMPMSTLPRLSQAAARVRRRLER
jgi:hypothetical protein